jgi:hypothetical protein
VSEELGKRRIIVLVEDGAIVPPCDERRDERGDQRHDDGNTAADEPGDWDHLTLTTRVRRSHGAERRVRHRMPSATLVRSQTLSMAAAL